VPKAELRNALAAGWVIESVQLINVKLWIDPTDLNFSEGGPKAWFVVVRRA
jgi:hypothetical protein